MKTAALLRVIAWGLFIFLAAKPVATLPDPGTVSQWAVLMDTSGSMRIKDPDARIDRAKAVVGKFMQQHTTSALFRFDADAAPVATGDISAVPADGRRTDLSRALKTVFSERDYRGAIVVTDGRQVGVGEGVSAARGGGKPLLLVGIGNGSEFKDIAVRKIQGPPFAFKGLAAALTATVSIAGYPGQDVVVKLRDGDRVLSMQTVKVPAREAETSVTFNWTPDALGNRTLTVEAATYAGEATTVNNRKDLVLDVGRDRFRVLYICGEPGPEYGFLRQQFKSDPAVELVTFVILRNPANVVSVPEGELALIPFPTQDTLITQMKTFDLVVFEEFSYHQYGLLPNVLYAVRQRVQEGGSFLLVGGPQTFGQGSPYAIPGISDMIPVNFGTADVVSSGESLTFVPLVESHPILRLDPNPTRNKQIWNALPALDDVTLLPSVKTGATAVGAVRRGGKQHPVLTVWRHGKGRVAVMSARTTWKWSLNAGTEGAPGGAYQQFWKNMVLWMTRAEDFKTVRVALEGRTARLGEDERLRVWVFDEYFKPVPDADVRVQLTLPDGTQETLAAHPETGGVFAAGFKAAQPGKYEATVSAQRGGRRLGADTARFNATESRDEDEDLRADFDLLRGLADSSNGRFITAEEPLEPVFAELDRALAESSGRKVLLWNSPWVLAGLLFVLGAEWWIRRRRGLP